MNLVRLALIATLGGIAWYALSIYAAIPPGELGLAPTSTTTTISFMCPAVTNGHAGWGAIVVAATAVVGAIVIAAVDLHRRVY